VQGADAVENPRVQAGAAESDGEAATYVVDLAVYGSEALFRACYLFTDRCYLFLTQVTPMRISVELRPKPQSVALLDVVGAFANELINQRLRADLARETKAIRERIVAEAFGEAEFRSDGR
jgi:His-Xaa-Ser system protein HxsD